MLTLTLNQQQLNIILNALGQRPFVEVAEIMNIIAAQAREQAKKKDDKKVSSK